MVSSADAPRRGMTLLEVLVVLIIVAIMLGLTVSIFQGAGRDVGAAASANAVAGLVRQAATHARVQSTPLWVVLDAGNGTVHAVTREVLGNWHFESGAGARDVGSAAAVRGGSRTNGRLGMGVYLDGSATLSLGRVAPIDPAQGFFVELWVRRGRKTANQQALLKLGTAGSLDMDRVGMLQWKLGGQTLKAVRAVPIGVWTHMMAVYDPSGELRLYTQGALNAARAAKAALPAELELTVGDARSGFIGDVDEVLIGQLVPRDKVKLGQEARLAQPDGAPLGTGNVLRIHFGPDGCLDPRLHPGPVRFAVISGAETHAMTVQPGGAVVREAAGP